jgi:hypothetical protein
MLWSIKHLNFNLKPLSSVMKKISNLFRVYLFYLFTSRRKRLIIERELLSISRNISKPEVDVATLYWRFSYLMWSISGQTNRVSWREVAEKSSTLLRERLHELQIEEDEAAAKLEAMPTNPIPHQEINTLAYVSCLKIYVVDLLDRITTSLCYGSLR